MVRKQKRDKSGQTWGVLIEMDSVLEELRKRHMILLSKLLPVEKITCCNGDLEEGFVYEIICRRSPTWADLAVEANIKDKSLQSKKLLLPAFLSQTCPSPLLDEQAAFLNPSSQATCFSTALHIALSSGKA